MGILNGTCNYILTRMEQDGLQFADALKIAQDKGFAEADPTADIEGGDPACKIAILSGIVNNMNFDPAKVHTEGISKITAEDIATAKELGYAIRLVGIYNGISKEGKADVRVHPLLFPKAHPLASINFENNALMLNGSAVGDLMFYGKGAGQMPTASAVTGDVLLLADAIKSGHGAVESMRFDFNKTGELLPIGETENAYYVRLQTKDKPGVVGHLGQACGNHGVSIKAVLQKPVASSQNTATIVLMTHKVKEADFQKALKEIANHDTIESVGSVIRVLEND